MTTRGLLVRLEVQHGKDDEAEEFLRSAIPIVRTEPGTTAWFAVRFGRSDYGIIDVFPDDESRQAHLSGAVAASLMQRQRTLLAKPPDIQRFDILADKLPRTPPAERVTKGLLLTFKAKSGNEDVAAKFLRDAKPLVEAEPETIAWFAIRLDNGDYGIFDVFPDHGGRFKHLTGQVPRELAKNALSLLGGLPDPELPNVLASTLDA
jgi:quinol monooxygenase YgiN